MKPVVTHAITAALAATVGVGIGLRGAAPPGAGEREKPGIERWGAKAEGWRRMKRRVPDPIHGTMEDVCPGCLLAGGQ